MAVVSARKFSVEETNLYAGSRGEPARMATNFLGFKVRMILEMILSFVGILQPVFCIASKASIFQIQTILPYQGRAGDP